MSSRKTVIRHGLAGGGFVTLLLAVSFVVALGVPTDLAMIALVAWLVVVGGTMFAAGRWERVLLGPATIEWPQIAAFAITVLALGWGVISLVSLLTGEGITGLGPIEAILTVVIVGYFAWFASECWRGGVLIDEETFVVE